jgi:hypothetical protein
MGVDREPQPKKLLILLAKPYEHCATTHLIRLTIASSSEDGEEIGAASRRGACVNL